MGQQLPKLNSKKLKLGGFFQFRQKKDKSLLKKLDQSHLQIIVSFLTIKEYNILKSLSYRQYEQLHPIQSSFQIRCQIILNIKIELIPSSKWIILLNKLLTIKETPFNQAIMAVRSQILPKPILVRSHIQLSEFQKSILYFENLSPQHDVSGLLLLNECRKFNNQSILIKLRQGEDVQEPLPQLLLIIRNYQEAIKSYLLYIDIRLENCELDEFLQLWKHYSSWIQLIETQSNTYIQLYNTYLSEMIPGIPKYSVRWFMTTQWIQKVPEALILKLRHIFIVLIKEQRITPNPKIISILKQYANYLLDINCHQGNIHIFGHTQFNYSNEVESIIKMLSIQTEQLYQQDIIQDDEKLLMQIFGKILYQQKIYDTVFQCRLQQLKRLIKPYVQEVKKEIVQIIQEKDNILEEQIGLPVQLRQLQFNPTQIVRTILRSLYDDDVKDDKEEKEEKDFNNFNIKYQHQESQDDQDQENQDNQDNQEEMHEIVHSNSLYSQASTRDSIMLSSCGQRQGVDNLILHLKKNNLYDQLCNHFIRQNEIHSELQSINDKIGLKQQQFHPLVEYKMQNIDVSVKIQQKQLMKIELQEYKSLLGQGITLSQLINQQYFTS